MATIKVKRRHTTGGTASTADGELSVNSFDKKIFIGNGSSAIEISNQVGYSTIATVGTITSGTWNGSAIGTAYGGTGLTSFTSKGLLYASSTSALTTGSEFYITETTGAGQSRRLNVDSTARTGLIGYKTRETTLGGQVTLGISCDNNSTSATVSQANLTLTSAGPIGSSIGLNSIYDTNILSFSVGSNGSGNTNIGGYLNDFDSNYQILEVIDDVTTPYIIFGPETTTNYIKMDIGSAITEIKTTTLKINTSTPSPGMMLTCTASDGTVEWQDNTGSTLALFNSGII